MSRHDKGPSCLGSFFLAFAILVVFIIFLTLSLATP